MMRAPDAQGASPLRDPRYAPETAALQETLRAAGYDLVIDGVMGPKTAAAVADYQRRLAEAPAPPKPWWTSRALLGALATLIVGLASTAGYVIDGAALAELLVAIATAAAGALSFYGTLKRKQPIDPTLVARGTRLPGRVRHADTLPPDASRPASGQPRRDPRGLFSDDF